MAQSVYLETTIVSYLAARPSADLIRAARRKMTQSWWRTRRGHFELYVSQVVLDEAGRGDSAAARKRITMLRGVPRLEITPAVVSLAEQLLKQSALPPKAATDALHVALAAAHGMDFLMTWNCSHIANAQRMGDIRATVVAGGYQPPLICTPEEMLGEWE